MWKSPTPAARTSIASVIPEAAASATPLHLRSAWPFTSRLPARRHFRLVRGRFEQLDVVDAEIQRARNGVVLEPIVPRPWPEAHDHFVALPLAIRREPQRLPPDRAFLAEKHHDRRMVRTAVRPAARPQPHLPPNIFRTTPDDELACGIDGIYRWERLMKTLRTLAVLAASGLPLAAAAGEDEPGFVPLFDGQTLNQWEGDPAFWRVEDGAIVGQTTETNKSKKNTFLIYRGGEFADFELRFSYQVEGFNSGVQYRSTDRGNHVMKGLQADFEARWHDDGTADKFSGMFFEENGRMFMAQRGEAVIVRHNPEAPDKPLIEKIASLGDPAELEQAIHRDGWNDYRILAIGNQFTHIINGRVMSFAIDEDEANFRASGLIGFQLHGGPPMKIQIKDLRIRTLGTEGS